MSGEAEASLATIAWGEGSGGLISPPRGLGAADGLSSVSVQLMLGSVFSIQHLQNSKGQSLGARPLIDT